VTQTRAPDRRRSASQSLPHLADNLPCRRHYPEDHEAATIDNYLVVHEDFVFAVMPVDRVDLDPELAAEPCRHTDGMQTGDSERAITNCYAGHGGAPFWGVAIA
jgi:hypothetical protein